MRQLFIISFFVITTTAYSQRFSKDTISNFSLTYISSGGGRDNTYIVTINSRGKVNASLESLGAVCGRKKIRLDKNTFRRFKNIIITKSGIYSLKQDKTEKHCHDCSFEHLEIKSNYGTKVLEGYDLQDINENVKLLFDTLDEMVGFIGTDNDE